MLDIVRKNSGSFLMYPILGAIIFIFAVTFGPGGGSCDGAPGSWAAKVNGEVIRQQDFAVFYNQRLDQMRQALGGGQGLDPAILERLGLRRQVIDGLIDRKLLSQEGVRRGLAVSDEELVAYMTENFGLDNITPQQFENYVQRTYRMPVWRFEEDVRNEILGQKVASVLTDNLSVSEDEVKEQFGSRAKLIDALIEMGKRTGDEGYRTHLERYPIARLLDLHRARGKGSASKGSARRKADSSAKSK